MTAPAIRTTRLRSGEDVPVLGQGTWGLAEDPGRRASEIAALRHGVDLGVTVIDTAEMYADGGAEELVGEALGGRRDKAFLVSKVLPGNATRHGTVAACERSLGRLRTDRLDLYLLHWRNPAVRLEETLEAFAELQATGMIRSWGVSNFDVDDLREVERLTGGAEVATDQVLYNLARRGVECDLMHWCRGRRLPVMAYSPLDQGRLLDDPAVQAVSDRYGVSPAQLALAWVLRRDGVIAIPRAGVGSHVDENRAALKIALTDRDVADLDRAFPPPEEPRPLEML